MEELPVDEPLLLPLDVPVLLVEVLLPELVLVELLLEDDGVNVGTLLSGDGDTVAVVGGTAAGLVATDTGLGDITGGDTLGGSTMVIVGLGIVFGVAGRIGLIISWDLFELEDGKSVSRINGGANKVVINKTKATTPNNGIRRWCANRTSWPTSLPKSFNMMVFVLG